ncbi:hypothetical protein [Streptomyces sp. NBC_00696]|uniref:hypothetical protein n=1 Tax=Streptomyces sp. NBC_00696 TaxID=2903672 RepID=UPI002E32BA30|nr:hypothetical protein [Streptomyces sp. NBC_00696]
MNNKLQYTPPSTWFRRLVTAILVITGIVRMATGKNVTWIDVTLIAAGCIMLGLAGWQEVQRFIKENRGRREAN